jgi:DNA-binding NtrC family response regulator
MAPAKSASISQNTMGLETITASNAFADMSSETAAYALVVDDDPLVLLLSCTILEEAGYRFFQARDVEEALGVLRQNGASISLLFTDVEMPGTGNGFDLARQVARDWPSITIVVASGRMAPAPSDLPATATFLPKPFTPDVVLEHLRRVLPEEQRPASLMGST